MALGRIFPLIGTWLLFYLAFVGGLMLCVLPGILFAFWFALATQVVVVEGTAGFPALSRSKALVKGNIATLFVLMLLLGVIGFGIGFGFSMIPQQHLQVVGSQIAGAIAGVFGAAAVVVFYFSCRCKHENFDLVLLAQAVGEEPPADAAAVS